MRFAEQVSVLDRIEDEVIYEVGVSSKTISSRKKISSLGTVKKTTVQLPAEMRFLADSIGDFIEYFGFKKIHGRIWAHLFLSNEPLAAVELCRRLKVSKTLLSFSIADLLKYEVIQEAGKGPRRTVYYRANPNVAWVILNVLRAREKKMMSDIYGKFLALEKTVDSSAFTQASLSPERVRELGGMIQVATLVLEAVLSTASDMDSDGLTQKFGAIATALM
jgi:DNA-binding transcriptional regulator GbsR (MarR family)